MKRRASVVAWLALLALIAGGAGSAMGGADHRYASARLLAAVRGDVAAVNRFG